MMNEAMAPYAPLNTPKFIAPGVRIVEGPEIRFSYLGLKLPFPTRMTIVRLPGGSLWLHSPTEPDEALFQSIGKLGPIGFLIAPNTLHYWWIPDWKERFPSAQVYAVPGLEPSAKRRLPAQAMLSNAPPPAWAGVIDQVLIVGDLLTEAVFFHRPSRTLILTDLIENFETNQIRSWFYRKLISWSGAADPDGKAPIDMQLSFYRWRKPLRAAVEKMIAWKPQRIILAHGRWYDKNAEAELRRAFRWVL